ncbi:MAG: hypothetical protein QM734_07490 [Cyclobacteriaceae bacterium]
MVKFSSLLLLVVFVVFTARICYVSSENKKLVVASETDSFPNSDETPVGEEDVDLSLLDLDFDDFQFVGTELLSLFSVKDDVQFELQQHIFNDLPIEVITPPPKI